MKRRAVLAALAGMMAAPLAHAAGGAKPGAKKVSGSENYVHVPTFQISISTALRFAGLMSIDSGLDIPDRKLRERAEALMPRLRDRMRQAASGYCNGLYEPGTVPDADLIHARMQKAADATLGPGARLALAAIIVHPGR